MNADSIKDGALSREEFKEWLKASSNINEDGNYNPEQVVEAWSKEGRHFDDLPDYIKKAFDDYMYWDNIVLPFMEENDPTEY
ncbi:MAG: hypothetical protein AB4050_17125 [Synechococcus sp.]